MHARPARLSDITRSTKEVYAWPSSPAWSFADLSIVGCVSLQTPGAAEPQPLESLAQKPRHGKEAKHASGQDKSYKPRSKKQIDLINFQATEVLSRAMKVDVILQDEEALVLDIQMYV